VDEAGEGEAAIQRGITPILALSPDLHVRHVPVYFLLTEAWAEFGTYRVREVHGALTGPLQGNLLSG